MFAKLSTIIRQVCRCLIQVQQSPSGEVNIPTIPTIPTVTTYITAYRYIELASTPTVPAVQLSFELSTLLSFVFFGLLLVFSVMYSLSKVGSTIVQLKRQVYTDLKAQHKSLKTAHESLVLKCQAHDNLEAQNESLKTANESLLVKQSSLLQNLDHSKTAAERKAFGVQQLVRYLEWKVTSLKDELARKPRPEIVIKSTDKTLLRSVMAKKWAEDPNGPVAQRKAVVKELKDAQLLLSEVSTELSRSQEKADALRSEVEALRANKSTADEKIERFTKRCEELTEHRDHWYKQYRKCTDSLKAEQLKTKDLTEQVNICNDKVEPLKAELASLRTSYAEALNTIEILEVDISQRKTPAEWDQMVCKWMRAEKLVTRESDCHSTLRIDCEHLKWKFECLEAEVRNSNGRSNRSKGDILKALYHSDKPAPNSKAESVELDSEKKLRNDAEKHRDNAVRELEILKHRFNEYARIQVASETDKLNTALAAREDQCAKLLQQMEEANKDILRQREELRDACQLMENYKQELEKRDQDHKIHIHEKEVMKEVSRQELEATLNQRGNDYLNQLKAEHSGALAEQENQYRHDLGQQEANYNNKIQQKESACHERIQVMNEDCNQRLAQRDNAHQVVVRGKEEAFHQALEQKDLMYQAAVKEKDDARKELANYDLLLQQKDRALKRAQQKGSEAEKKACDELRRLHEHIADTFSSIQKLCDTADDLYDEATEPPFPESMNVDENVSLTTEKRLEQLCSLFEERNNIIIARDEEISDLKGKLSRRSSATGKCDHLKELKELNDQAEKDFDEIENLEQDIEKVRQELDDLIACVHSLAVAVGREADGDHLAFAQDTLETLSKILNERVDITGWIQEYWKQFYTWE
jgi:hypothetical protein